ncbi:hypothetical protein GPN2_22714 [Streptomyces murinus]
MAEITGQGPARGCELRQRKPGPRWPKGVRAVAQYRSHIPELSGFARARCPSDADRCWSSGPEMRDNGLEAICSMPVSRVRSVPRVPAGCHRQTMSWFQEGERAWRP